MNYSNLSKFFTAKKGKYLIDIFFLLVLLIAGIRLENILHITEDYSCYPDLVNRGIIISDQDSDELTLTDWDNSQKAFADDACETGLLYSYKIALRICNSLNNSKYKSNTSRHIDTSTMISILQKTIPGTDPPKKNQA